MNDRTLGYTTDDLLANEHVKAVYDFTSELFPLHDADNCLDHVFARAHDERIGDESELARWILFGYVVELMTRRHPDDFWWRENADAVCRRLERAAGLAGSPDVRHVAEPLTRAFRQLTPPQQVLLAMMTVTTHVPSDAYHIILDVEADEATRRTEQVRSRLAELLER